MSFDTNLYSYGHIVGLSFILPNLITYSLVLMYFRYSKAKFPSVFCNVKIKNNFPIIILLIMTSFAMFLIDIPFLQWKSLSNEYFGTSFTLPNYSNYKFEAIQTYKIVSVLAIAPFFEEIVFRYYFFDRLLTKYNFRTAILTSSFLFSIIHISSPKNLIPSFYFGIVSAIIYYRTKNISYSIILHITYNVLWVLTFIFAKQYDQLIKKVGWGMSFWFIFLFGIFLCLLGIKRITKASNKLSEL